MEQQRTEEWFKKRANRVTGSNVGAILGMSPFMKPEDVMRNMGVAVPAASRSVFILHVGRQCDIESSQSTSPSTESTTAAGSNNVFV